MTSLASASERGKYGPWTTPGVINEAFNLTFVETDRAIVSSVLGGYAMQEAPILEIGSGLGALGVVIPETYTPHYIQTDRTPLYAQMSKKRNDRFPTMASDAENLPLRDASVGTVVAMDVFDMLESQAESSAEIRRVLRPGGTFIHFHDRRPNIGSIVRHLRAELSHHTKSFVMLPGIEDSTLTHLRLVARSVFNDFLLELDSAHRDLLETYAEKAETIDVARVQNPREVDMVAMLAREIPGINSDYFSSMFVTQTTDALRKVGFEDIKASFVKAEAIVSDDCLKYLFGKDFLYRRAHETRHLSNVLTKNQHGRYELLEHDSTVPPKHIRQIGLLSVIVAQK